MRASGEALRRRLRLRRGNRCFGHGRHRSLPPYLPLAAWLMLSDRTMDRDGEIGEGDAASPSYYALVNVACLRHGVRDLGLRESSAPAGPTVRPVRAPGEVLRHECPDVLELWDADELDADIRHVVKRRMIRVGRLHRLQDDVAVGRGLPVIRIR